MPEDYFDLPPAPERDPVEGTDEYNTLEWCETRLKRGIKFIESQVGYDKIEDNLKEIFAYEMSSTASYVPGQGSNRLSETRANLIAKIGEDLTADLTDTRLFWKYSSLNPRYQQNIDLANKSAEQWYKSQRISERIADVIRFYDIAGCGIAHLYYSRIMDDMYLDAEDPRNVFPIDPMDYSSFESCVGVISRRPRTPEWVKQEFNKVVRAENTAVGKFYGWLKRVIDGPGTQGGPLSKKSSADVNIEGTDILQVNTMYLKDPRLNKTGKIIRMGPWRDGKPTTPWSYEVKPDMPLFPLRRLIVWGNGVLLHDDTSPYWWAKFPLIKLTLNPWPKTWFGKAPLTDCVPLQRSINANLRVIDDHAAQVAQPGVLADRNVSKAEMNRFNSRLPGYKIRTNMASGKGLQVQNPPALDQTIWEVVKWCQEVMRTIAGTADISQVSSLAQIPSDDTIDTLMKAMTPAVRLRSRMLEGFYTEIAKGYLASLLEFDTMSKRLARFGPAGVTAEDFDYRPGSMIPDAVPDGSPGDIASLLQAWMMDNPPSRMDMGRLWMMQIGCDFDPSSLLNSAAQPELMKYFLLAKMGYISVFTLFEKMGITNFAPADLIIPPDEVSRLALQANLGIGMVANAQGRKATDSAPPAMGENANGPTITTS